MSSADTLHENYPPSSDDPNFKPWFKVALIEPEIPQNTGNIGRTCVGARAELQLVGDLGFRITDRNLKRAGLDYWQHLKWKHYEKFAEWERQIPDQNRVFYFSTKAEKTFYEFDYQIGDTFVFGKETKGLDPELLLRNNARMVKIPQFGPIRSLNVATAVAIVLYEAIRQVQYK